jgi:predicted Fe-S protein YdhL (DUF1289 family)
MSGIHITDIEAAINWWRERLAFARRPDGLRRGARAGRGLRADGLLPRNKCDDGSMPAQAQAAWLAWYASTPDAPCIAICSTSQGDAICKGCGRSFDEVQHWPAYSPAQKRGVWRRITMEGTAWRFNRYAERAQRATGVDHPNAETLEAAPGSRGTPRR